MSKKLSEALKALTSPDFDSRVEMPAIALDGTNITATPAEINFLDGVTSAIQTQLNAKAASTHAHAGTDIASGTIAGARLPAMSTTAQGSVPATTTATGSQVLADNGWTSKNNVYTDFQTIADASPLVWNMNNGYNAKVTLVGNRALSITNIANGMSGCLIVIQDAIGGHTLTLPASSYMINGETSLTLSSGSNAIDMLTFVRYDNKYFWSVGNNYVPVV